jgi:hypothetical protein
MEERILLFDPTAPPQEHGQHTRRVLDGLAGKVVGFIDNAKPNFDFLVEDLSELLISKYGVSRVITCRKSAASIPVPEALLHEVTEQCDLVITGSGD